MKNHNVSPLIPQVIDRLRGCTLFTKVNIHWGYNNIQIKGDKWKAAFLTPEGLFKPTVMFFWPHQLPGHFPNDDEHHLLNQGCSRMAISLYG